MNNMEIKELKILREAVDKSEKIMGKKNTDNESIQNIIKIVEQFIAENKLICYGGTAINNILPKKVQFYDKNLEIPDYDFFSINALKDAVKLADIYKKEGYEEIEAKAGMHEGTFKLFVNYIPVADITQMDKEIYNKLYINSIIKNNIHYAPANFLRMNMYLELSRPAGDTSRWEKVLKRLILLNKYYPLKGIKCYKEKYQREYTLDKKDGIKLFNILINFYINNGYIFLGGYANILYNNYLPNNKKINYDKNPDIDILAINPEKTAKDIIDLLKKYNFTDVKYIKHNKIGEIISDHYEIIVNGDTISFIFEPLACHSYNIIKKNNKNVKVASIDTILSFYLAFLYTNRDYFNDNRLLCMAENLLYIQIKNRLKQKGLLKRFSIKCYGNQLQFTDIKAIKNNKYKLLKTKKKSKEYKYNFLRYIP